MIYGIIGINYNSMRISNITSGVSFPERRES